MKVWKKNMVAAAVLVTVCAGIYVNWLYSEEQMAANLTDTLDSEKLLSSDQLVMGEEVVDPEQLSDSDTTITDYFAAVRLSRQEARDSAVSVLQEAMAYTGSEANKEESSTKLEMIVQTALTEAQIESLVIAKGYADCVAYIGDDGISVAVAAPEGGLQQTDVAVIADIVMAQSEFELDKIRVVEVQ
jgi:stage III sporulation protein AH